MNIFSAQDKITYEQLAQALIYYKYYRIPLDDTWFIFYHEEMNRFFTLHNPDLKEDLSVYQIEQAIEEFKEAGLLNEESTEI